MTEPYQFLPALAADDLERLKADIAANGVEVPVVVDEDGNIIDGHNRAMIADSLGIEYRRDVRRGLTDTQKRRLALRLNLNRRHMTDAQKVIAGREIEQEIAAEARDRQREAGRATGLMNASDQMNRSIPEGIKGTGRDAAVITRDVVAKEVGIGSGITYQRGKAVVLLAEQTAPDLYTEMEAGNKTIEQVKRELNKRRKGTAPVTNLAKERTKRTRKQKKDETGETPSVPLRLILISLHDVLMRLKTIRTLGGPGSFASGVERESLIDELQNLRNEIDVLLDKARSGHSPTAGRTSGGPRGRAIG